MTEQTKAITPYEALRATLQKDVTIQRFADVGASADFRASILSLVAQDDRLANCTQRSILTAAFKAAVLKLPIEPALGLAHIVAYGNEATFIPDVKGVVNLAERTGMYSKINYAIVREGQEVIEDFVSGDIEVEGRPDSPDAAPIGYLAYFKLTNGLEKALYWDRDYAEERAKRYSPAYRADIEKGRKKSPWSTHNDQMHLGKVLKHLLKHWGPKSIEYYRGGQVATIDEDGIAVPDFSDAIEGEAADVIDQAQFYAAVVTAGYSNNEHNVKAALKHSTNYFETADDMVAWFRLYRGHKDTGKDTATAASMADAGEVPA